MRAKLKYNTTKTGVHITPNSGGATYEFDVYATRKDPRSIRVALVGAGLYVLAMAIALFQWNRAEDLLEDAVSLIDPALGGSALILVGVVGFALALYNIKKLESMAFVECKDLKGKVGRPLISQVAGRMQEFGNPEKRKAGREAWMVVSSSGFTRHALEAASVHGILCYEGKDRTFKRIRGENAPSKTG